MAVALSTYVREEHDGHADPLCLLSRAHCPAPAQLRPAAAGAPPLAATIGWPHLVCADACTRNAEPHSTAGAQEPIPDPFEIVYLTHCPCYRFSLVIPRVVPSAVRRRLALFRSWLTGQAPQDGIVLTLPERTSCHEDLGQWLEHLRRLRSARHRAKGKDIHERALIARWRYCGHYPWVFRMRTRRWHMVPEDCIVAQRCPQCAKPPRASSHIP
jgi:hypothetical protein